MVSSPAAATSSAPPLNTRSLSDPSSIYHDAISSPKERTASDTSEATAAPQYSEREENDQAHTVLPMDVKSPVTNGQVLNSPAPPTPQERHDRAESTLDAKTKHRLSSAEFKDAKKMSKLIQKEQKESNTTLKAVLKELAAIQLVHKKALRAENKATAKHAQAVKAEHKANTKFIEAQAKHQKAATELTSRADGLSAFKKHAAEKTTLLVQKTDEVEKLRAKKAIDDREREAKLQSLAKNPTGV